MIQVTQVNNFSRKYQPISKELWCQVLWLSSQYSQSFARNSAEVPKTPTATLNGKAHWENEHRETASFMYNFVQKTNATN